MASAPYPTYQALRRRRAMARREQALHVAAEALDLLERMGAKALLTGSLAEGESRFRPDSDIDIVVTERPDGVTREALERGVSDLESPIRIDLVFLEDVTRVHVRHSLLRKARR